MKAVIKTCEKVWQYNISHKTLFLMGGVNKDKLKRRFVFVKT